MKINHLFGFSELFHAHQTATFLAVLAPTILHSGVVRLPTWCRINWIFVCRASFHQVTASIDALRLLLLHAYYFCASTCQRTILLLSVLGTLVWRKIVAARTTYFIRYKDLPLRRQRGIQLLNGTKKKSVTEVRFELTALGLGNQMLYPLSYSVKIGAKKAKRIDIAPNNLPL